MSCSSFKKNWKGQSLWGNRKSSRRTLFGNKKGRKKVKILGS